MQPEQQQQSLGEVVDRILDVIAQRESTRWHAWFSHCTAMERGCDLWLSATSGVPVRCTSLRTGRRHGPRIFDARYQGIVTRRCESLSPAQYAARYTEPL